MTIASAEPIQLHHNHLRHFRQNHAMRSCAICVSLSTLLLSAYYLLSPAGWHALGVSTCPDLREFWFPRGVGRLARAWRVDHFSSPSFSPSSSSSFLNPSHVKRLSAGEDPKSGKPFPPDTRGGPVVGLPAVACGMPSEAAPLDHPCVVFCAPGFHIPPPTLVRGFEAVKAAPRCSGSA